MTKQWHQDFSPGAEAPPDIQKNTGDDPLLGPFFLDAEHEVLSLLDEELLCPALSPDARFSAFVKFLPCIPPAALLQVSEVIIHPNPGASKLAPVLKHRQLVTLGLKLHNHKRGCSTRSSALHCALHSLHSSRNHICSHCVGEPRVHLFLEALWSLIVCWWEVSEDCIFSFFRLASLSASSCSCSLSLIKLCTCLS